MISDEQLVRRCQRRPQLLEQPLIRGIVTEPPLATADQRFGGASVRAFTRRRLTGIGAVPPGSLQKEMPFRINRPKKNGRQRQTKHLCSPVLTDTRACTHKISG